MPHRRLGEPAIDPSPIDPHGFDDFREDLRRVRRYGEVVVLRSRHTHADDPDEAVRQLLMNPPPRMVSPSQWDVSAKQRGEVVDDLGLMTPLDRATAQRLLALVIRFDLAYEAEITAAATADELAERIVSTMPPTTKWFSNGDYGLTLGPVLAADAPPSLGWMPLTDATFDTGVIGASDEHLLVVWFLDEDQPRCEGCRSGTRISGAASHGGSRRSSSTHLLRL